MLLLKTYYPIPRFPPISLSGAACALQCRHCDAHYLGGMLPAATPEVLVERCRALARDGAVGALLSGGSDKHGRILNLASMTEAIRTVKRETNLILNVHPGLIDVATAQQLAVDFASLDIPGDDVIRRVMGLDATTADYIDAYRALRHAGIDVVPHVTVYTGDEAELLRDIRTDSDAQDGGRSSEDSGRSSEDGGTPSVVVIIVFSPTRGTPMADEPAPGPEAVARVIGEVKGMFPETEVALGCMRPRARALRDALEVAALDAGVSRMVLPSQRTLRYARSRGYTITQYDACCALPEALGAIAVRNP